MMGYALEGTPPLRWLEGSDFSGTTSAPEEQLALRRRAISRAQRAAYYIDGRIMRHGDSSRVILRLNSVAGDSVVAREHAAARSADADVTQLGLQAIGRLLVPLLEPGRHVDRSTVANRPPAAIAAFLQAERAYRASHFEQALERYHSALAADSGFALAALNGAQAALWIERTPDARQLAQLALARATGLPAHRAIFVRGMDRYLAGSADSAVAEFKRAIAADADRSEPWMALGEVYRHLLPQASGLDSLAEGAFAAARQKDTTFTPPIYHLAELALRRGATGRADSLIRAYSQLQPDSALRQRLDLMLRCSNGGMNPASWLQAARNAPLAVLEAGVVLAGSAAPPDCAEQAFRAVLAADDASPQRWGALLGLQSLLVAAGRDREAVELLQSPVAAALGVETLLLLDAAAGASVHPEAEALARTLGQQYGVMSPPRLWLLAAWEATRGQREQVALIASALQHKADSSHTRRDSLLVRAVAAYSALARGDTTGAITRLRTLAPSAPREELAWSLWDGFGGERLLLARLLLARGQYREAREIAGALDVSQSIVYLVYLRPALLVQAQAAEALRDSRGAAQYRKRYAHLAQRAAPARGTAN